MWLSRDTRNKRGTFVNRTLSLSLFLARSLSRLHAARQLLANFEARENKRANKIRARKERRVYLSLRILDDRRKNILCVAIITIIMHSLNVYVLLSWEVLDERERESECSYSRLNY